MFLPSGRIGPDGGLSPFRTTTACEAAIAFEIAPNHALHHPPCISGRFLLTKPNSCKQKI